MVKKLELAAKVRDGLFLASSRTYAEQYIEPLLRDRYDLLEPSGGDYDAIGKDGTKYEIKACKVLLATKNGKGSRSILERILFELTNLETARMVKFSESESAEYLANVQNVKRDHFDILLYALLFEDCIKVFSAKKDQIASGTFKSWSEKHGRYDALGKSGQFGITRATVGWHLKNHLKDTITYDEATAVFERLSTTEISE